jgi:hypothetical protein
LIVLVLVDAFYRYWFIIGFDLREPIIRILGPCILFWDFGLA